MLRRNNKLQSLNWTEFNSFTLLVINKGNKNSRKKSIKSRNHWFTSAFYGAFVTGVACQQGTLTLMDTWFCSLFWDLLMLQLWDQIPELCCVFTWLFTLNTPRYFLDFALYQVFTAVAMDMDIKDHSYRGTTEQHVFVKHRCIWQQLSPN